MCEIAIANLSIESAIGKTKIAEKHVIFLDKVGHGGNKHVSCLIKVGHGARKLSVGPEAGTESSRRLSAGREEKEMSIATKLEERDGGLRKVAGMVKGRTHRRSSEEWRDCEEG